MPNMREANLLAFSIKIVSRSRSATQKGKKNSSPIWFRKFIGEYKDL